MNPSREEALFALALEKPVETQITILDALCEGNPFQRDCRSQTAAHPPRPERQPTVPQATPFLQEGLDLTVQ
jgi:hypothetical protein